MYILEPTSRERIWGTARLHEYHGDHKNWVRLFSKWDC